MKRFLLDTGIAGCYIEAFRSLALSDGDGATSDEATINKTVNVT